MSKKKPVFNVERSLADMAKELNAIREEGESADRMVGVVTRGLSALTVRVENAEKAVNSLLAEVAELRKPARTWFQFFNGE